MPIITNINIFMKSSSCLLWKTAAKANSPINRFMPPYTERISDEPKLELIVNPTSSTKDTGSINAQPPNPP